MRIRHGLRWACAIALSCLIGAGCRSTSHHVDAGIPGSPRELDKITLPDHVIAPPDVLNIEGIRLVPRPPYRIEPLDSVFIRATGLIEPEPIEGVFIVEPNGQIILGGVYGATTIAGLTLEEAQQALQKQLRKSAKRAEVLVSVVESRALQLISGEHLVQPNGKVDLGSYGSVYVTGLTTEQARQMIEAHLSNFLQNPKILVSMAAYNSQVYYIITDGGGFGEQVFRLPATGNETVLDAVSQIFGLPAVASRERIWLARPAPAGESAQVLPINWKGITQCGESTTNYQVLPGDRIYVQARPIIAFDTFLTRVLLPVERMFGITLLGNEVIEAVMPGIGTVR